MQKPYCFQSAINFLRTGITLSLLILLNSVLYADTAHTDAPYSKGKDYSTAECTYTLSGTSRRVGAEAASNRRFTVTITGSCSWTATSNVPWITIISVLSTTSSDVVYSCSVNTTTAERIGIITVGDKIYTVTQAGLPAADDYEPNNTAGAAKELIPEFIQNASTIFILPANCHTIDDIDYYKINLGTDIYTIYGKFYYKDAYNTYTLEGKSSYSLDGLTWHGLETAQWFRLTISGTLYLKIESNEQGNVGSYAAKIDINKVATAGCTYSLSATSSQVASDIGTGQVTVTPAGTSCFWAATSNTEWITLTSGQATTGTGSVDYYYGENTSTYSRTGTIMVASQTYTVTQAARLLSPDRYEPNNTVAGSYIFTPTLTQSQNVSTINISPANYHNKDDVDIYKINLGTAYTSYTVSGMLYDRSNDRKNYTFNAQISYSTNGGTSWNTWAWGGQLSSLTVQSESLYLKVEAYTGSGSVVGSYAAKIDIIGGCTYTLSPTSKQVESEAGTDQEVTVTTNSSCPWTATANASWITLTSDQKTTGSGKVKYSYTKNIGMIARTGKMTIAGYTYTVTQAAAKDPVTVTPTLNADGYEENNTLETAKLLTPTFTQNVGALSISPANCHNVDDIDIYKVNLGTAYTSYTVSGALYDRDNQNNNSDYTLAAQIFYSTDGSDQSWKQWLRGDGGRGQLSNLIVPGGTLYLKVQPNGYYYGYYYRETGSYAVKIEITGGCTYSLLGASKQVASEAGSGQVTLIAGASSKSSCPWTAVSKSSWITISSGQATGSGSITYSYTKNTETYSRTGTITVAGYTYTLTQEASLSKDKYEDNNTVGAAHELTATFTQNASTLSISPANFHKLGDVDFYKIDLGTDSYTVNVVLYDLYNQNNNSDYTIDAKISYSTDATTWSDPKDNYLSGIPVRGTLYLKMAPFYSGWGLGCYAAKINILKVTADCTYNLPLSDKSVAADAGSGKVEVGTTPSCAWIATSNASWITLNSDQIITGTGSVDYSYNENMSTDSRTGTLMVADKTFTVTQAGRPLLKDGYEENNTLEAAFSFTPKFTNDESSISISPATCHEFGDVDYYKINLETGYSYTVGVRFYDLYRQNNNSNYSLSVKTFYSTDGTTWQEVESRQLLDMTVPAGTFYLKIEPYNKRNVGSYAAKVDIKATKLPVAGFETISHVQIFPNPAKEYVTLDFSSTDKNYAVLKIANVFGQVLYERENPHHKMQIPLKGLSTGLYFIILQGGEKAVVQKLMVE